jgi:DNA-binding CsgD family transcriptional regulator
MSERVQRLFEALPSQGSIDELGIVIDRIRDTYDLDNVSYLAVSLGQSYEIASRDAEGALSKGSGFWRRRAASLVASTYNPDWGLRYEEAKFMRIDPVVEGGVASFVPFDWKSLRWDTRQKKQVLNEAVDFGLGNQGYTVPIRGPNGQFALFTVNKTCSDESWASLIDEKRSDLLVISHFFHQRVLECERIFGDPPRASLSTRERDVLTYLAQGKTRAQLAFDLKISENTLRVYVDSARHKLGALNIHHAIAIGVTKGIIKI